MADVTIVREQLGEEAEAEIVRWLAADGERVEAGQAIVEVATAKIVFEISAPLPGRLRHSAAVGAIVPAGHVIATIGDD